MSAFTGKKIINFEAKLVSRREKMKIEEKTIFFEKKSILDEIWKSAKKCQKIDIFFKKKVEFYFHWISLLQIVK